MIAGPGSVTGAEKTVLFQTQDHFAVAGSTSTFVAIWQYLHQGADGGPDGLYPQYTTIQCGDPMVTIAGKSETFGDNAIPPGGSLEVYELGGSREGGAPLMTFTVGDAGTVGPWQANRLQAYEFKGLAADGGVIGHSYFEPFKRSDYWLRFLVPSTDPIAAIATTPVTSLNDDKETTIIARYAPGAFRYDLGDSLTVDGFQALNANDANRQSVTVGLFMYDQNKDGMSQGGSLSAYSSLPFLRGTDVFVPSSPPGLVQLNLNGKTLQVPNWPSQSQGLTFVFFPVMNRRSRRAAKATNRKGGVPPEPPSAPPKTSTATCTKPGERSASRRSPRGGRPRGSTRWSTAPSPSPSRSARGTAATSRGWRASEAAITAATCPSAPRPPRSSGSRPISAHASAPTRSRRRGRAPPRLDDVTRGVPWSPSARAPTPCAFLVDGACSIYALRPFVCRAWNSASADDCLEQLRSEWVQMRFDVFQRATFAGVEGGLKEALRAHALDAADLDFTAAMRVALEDATACQRWLAGEPASPAATRDRPKPPAGGACRWREEGRARERALRERGSASSGAPAAWAPSAPARDARTRDGSRSRRSAPVAGRGTRAPSGSSPSGLRPGRPSGRRTSTRRGPRRIRAARSR